MKLAIVDDDDDVRRAVSRLLRAMGHDVRVFSSAEAFEAETVVADCTIVDVRLTGLSGVDLCERLHSRPVPAPVVLITGDGDGLHREITRSVHTPLVTKPFDGAALMAAITTAISAAQSLRQSHAS
jgi:FixJ family two-component response regulator